MEVEEVKKAGGAPGRVPPAEQATLDKYGEYTLLFRFFSVTPPKGPLGLQDPLCEVDGFG